MTRAVNVAISVSPSGLYIRNYTALIRLLDDPRPMWAAIGKRLVESTVERFYKGKDPDGNKWLPSGEVRYNKRIWSRSTQEQLIENLVDYQRSTRTLVKSGKLAGSFHYKTSKEGVTVFTDSKYGRPHQYGAFIKAKKKAFMRIKTANGWRTVKQFMIPKRTFLGMTTEDRIMIRNTVKTYLFICFSDTVQPS